MPVLVADHPREVLGELAATVYGHPAEGLTTLGVTGTNGKTTTAYLIESALRARGQRTGLIGTVETRIGDERLDSVRTTPEATDLHALLGIMRERGIDACVMEVSSHALELHRVDGVVYDVALFTNLSQDHLDFHASMEDYFAAKASLFTPARSRAAVVCVDDAWGARLAREATCRPSTFASAPGRRSRLGHRGGRRWRLRRSARPRASAVLSLVSHLPGHFNVANTALAALALLTLGLEVPQVRAGAGRAAGRARPHGGRGARRPRRPAAASSTSPTPPTPSTPPSTRAAARDVRPARSPCSAPAATATAASAPAWAQQPPRRADVVVVTDDNPRSEEPGDIRAAVIAGAREARGVGRGPGD